MIVDDEQTTRDLLSQVVRLLGHEPVAASGGAQAIERQQEDGPDLVLLDLMMPEMDGYETMRRMRGLAGGGEVPIVIITASQELDVEERVADAGGDAVYYKPIGVGTISDIISTYTDSRTPDTAPLR